MVKLNLQRAKRLPEPRSPLADQPACSQAVAGGSPGSALSIPGRRLPLQLQEAPFSPAGTSRLQGGCRARWGSASGRVSPLLSLSPHCAPQKTLSRVQVPPPRVSLLSKVSEPLQSPQAFKVVLKGQEQQILLDKDLESPPPALLWPIPSKIRQQAHSPSLRACSHGS